MKGLMDDSLESREGFTVTLHHNVGFGNANDARRLADPVILQEDLAPLPGTEPTEPESLIDQIKEIVRKRQCPQSISRLKPHPTGEILPGSLSLRIREHPVTDVHTHQPLYRRIGSGRLDQPATCPTTHIQHSPQARRI